MVIHQSFSHFITHIYIPIYPFHQQKEKTIIKMAKFKTFETCSVWETYHSFLFENCYYCVGIRLEWGISNIVIAYPLLFSAHSLQNALPGLLGLCSDGSNSFRQQSQCWRMDKLSKKTLATYLMGKILKGCNTMLRIGSDLNVNPMYQHSTESW